MANENGNALDYVRVLGDYEDFVDANPFELKRDHSSAACVWKDSHGCILETFPQAYGAEVSLQKFTDEQGKAVLQYLTQGLKEKFLKRNARITSVGDTHSHIVKEPDNLSFVGFEKKINQNLFGFTNEYFNGAWTWVTEAGGVLSIDPEPPGLVLCFWNTSAEIETGMVEFVASIIGTSVVSGNC